MQAHLATSIGLLSGGLREHHTPNWFSTSNQARGGWGVRELYSIV